MDRITAGRRAALTGSMRRFFDERSFLELELPVASPFSIPESTIPLMTTSYNNPWKASALLALLPSPEYFIKQLLADGWGDVYSLGRAFRDAENLGSIHNPEFTMLEYYKVGADYRDTLRLTDELLEHLRDQASSSGVDVPAYARGPIRVVPMEEAFRDFAGSDLSKWADTRISENDALASAREEARRLDIRFDESDDWNTVFNRIFLNKVEPALPQDLPLALIDYPARIPCLGLHRPGSPWVERWELYIRGVEIANTFTEERDPLRIASFFAAEANALRESGHTTNPAMDFAEICARMPPVSGVAVGWDRLVMVLLGLPRIQDAMLFSLHRSLNDG